MENDRKISELVGVTSLTGKEIVPFAHNGVNGSFKAEVILNAIPSTDGLLTEENAEQTYLTKTSASDTYQPKGDYATTVGVVEALKDYVPKEPGKALSDNNYTTSEKNKLQSLENYDDTALTQVVGVLSDEMEILKNRQSIQDIAWGVPIKQDIQSGTGYGVVGNTSLWEEYKRMSGRYLVTNSGRAAKLSPTDSSLFADGTSVDETLGHVMWIGPRLYYRVENDPVGGFPVLWMSQQPIGGHYIGSANGGMYNCIGAYKGAMSGTTLVSRSGLVPAGSRSINSFWTAAQANSTDFGLADYSQRVLMMMLGLSEYGDTNIQARLGYGVCGSSGKDLWSTAVSFTAGVTKAMGDSWGKVDIEVVNGANVGVDCSRVNLMGIEDPYGWQWEMIQGVYCGNSGNTEQTGDELFLYKGNRMPAATELATHPEGEYRQGKRLTSSGNVKKIIAGEYFDIFPAETGGSSTSYWADYSWANTVGQLVLWGGTAAYGARCGLASAGSYAAWSASTSDFGARLAFYGDLTFVDSNRLTTP